MRIELNNLIIKNFKGIKSFDLSLDGDSAVIKAENGVGKTTIYDSFIWLFFDKDSSGRKQFDLRPLDKKNNPVKGLVVSVEANISIDGESHVFKKEHHEKIVKKQLRGYESLCWIDDVPKKVSEYTDYIAEIIPEDTFKLLTDLAFFNEKLHWTKRREALLELIDDFTKITPKGFDGLIAALNGRTIADYKKVMSDRKKRLEKEREEINPRIDEIQRSLDEYAEAEDDSEIEEIRERRQAELRELEAKRLEILDQESQRQKQIDYCNELKNKMAQRERELKNDTSGIQKYIDQKLEIEKSIAEIGRSLSKARQDVEDKETELNRNRQALESHTEALADIRQQYTKASETKDAETCYACGQKLPEDQLELSEQRKKDKLAEITKKGNNILRNNNECKEAIEKNESLLAILRTNAEAKRKEYNDANDEKAKRFKEIDKLIVGNPTTPADQDHVWCPLRQELAKVEAEIGEPVSEQLKNIQADIDTVKEEIAKYDKYLLQSDNIKKSAARIKELEAREKELAQLIADAEKQLADIDEYNMNVSRLIETAVNGKFEHVRFKLFNYLLNGSIEECCEAVFNGVPYADMSTGQKIFCGIDIVNVLSDHYGISVPLFIDHLESITMEIRSSAQIIGLKAVDGIKELTVETKETRKAVA